MRTPSRFLFPAVKSTMTASGWLVIALLCGLLLYWIYSMTVAFLNKGDPLIAIVAAVVGCLMVGGLHSGRRWDRRLRSLARQRKGFSLCDFARSFDTRSIDTWVIRAVWDVLSEQVNRAGPQGFTLPIFADDPLAGVFMLEDDEDLLDTLEDIAYRAGRTVAWTDQYKMPASVREVVMLLNAMPMTGGRKDRLFMTV